MNNLMIFLVAVVVLLFMLLRINIYIDLHACRHNENDHITLAIYALRPLFVYTIKIPMLEIIRYNDLPWITSKIKAPEGGSEGHIAREQRFVKKTAGLLIGNPKKFKKLIQGIRQFINGYRYYINTLVASLHCERLDIRAKYGFEDAAYTGIMMGVLGAAQGLLLSSLYKRLSMDTQPNIRIVPLYGKSYFEIELRCIFRIRLGKVISATMAILKKISHREATRSG